MIRVSKLTYFFIRGHPLSVYIAPHIAAKCTEHICVETYFFDPVIGCDGQTIQNLVPYIFLVLYNCIEIPAKFVAYLFLQIF